jgi:WD40 repeat protein
VLCAGAVDWGAKVWNVSTGGASRLDLYGQCAKLTSLALSDDNEWLVTAGSDGGISGWQLSGGKVAFRLRGRASADNSAVLSSSFAHFG